MWHYEFNTTVSILGTPQKLTTPKTSTTVSCSGLSRLIDYICSSAGPWRLCFVLIAPNFRSSLPHHIDVSLVWHWDHQFWDKALKCRFTLLSAIVKVWFTHTHIYIYNAFLPAYNVWSICLCHVNNLHRTPVLVDVCSIIFCLLSSRSAAAAVWMSSVYERTDWWGYRQSCPKPQSCMCSTCLEIGMFSNTFISFFHSSLGCSH